MVYGGKRNNRTVKKVFWMLISVLFFFLHKQDLSEQEKWRALQKLLHWVKVGSWIRYLDWRGMRDTQWEQRKLAFSFCFYIVDRLSYTHVRGY